MTNDDRCPHCGHRSDMNWPWCEPYGEDWGLCYECRKPAPHRARVATLKAERDRLDHAARRAIGLIDRALGDTDPIGPDLDDEDEFPLIAAMRALSAATQEGSTK